MTTPNNTITQNQKEDFYVFLDFDGVLYDLKYLSDTTSSFKELFLENKKVFNYAKDSIDALNKLFARLSTKYNPHLVISSFWRFLPTQLLIKSLTENGLDISNLDIHKTKVTLHQHKRGLEIKDFLVQQGNCENFIIADDSYLDNYLKLFPAEKIVKTNILNDRLVASKLDVPLAYYNLEPIQKTSPSETQTPNKKSPSKPTTLQKILANLPIKDKEM